MGILQSLFCTHAPQYLERFGQAMPGTHKKVIAAIRHCRSEDNGATVYQCAACGELHVVQRCCGNRHCPGCRHHKARQWLDWQLKRQLPGHHFMLTFTVPEAPQAPQQTRAHHGTADHGVHAPLSAARAAYRVHEGALLRIPVAELCDAHRGGQGAHRDGPGLRRAGTRNRNRSVPTHAVPPLRRGAAIMPRYPAAKASGYHHELTSARAARTTSP